MVDALGIWRRFNIPISRGWRTPGLPSIHCMFPARWNTLMNIKHVDDGINQMRWKSLSLQNKGSLRDDMVTFKFFSTNEITWKILGFVFFFKWICKDTQNKVAKNLAWYICSSHWSSVRDITIWLFLWGRIFRNAPCSVNLFMKWMTNMRCRFALREDGKG